MRRPLRSEARDAYTDGGHYGGGGHRRGSHGPRYLPERLAWKARERRTMQ